MSCGLTDWPSLNTPCDRSGIDQESGRRLLFSHLSDACSEAQCSVVLCCIVAFQAAADLREPWRLVQRAEARSAEELRAVEVILVSFEREPRSEKHCSDRFATFAHGSRGG